MSDSKAKVYATFEPHVDTLSMCDTETIEAFKGGSHLSFEPLIVQLSKDIRALTEVLKNKENGK